MKPIHVFLPWSDTQGVAALKQQLWFQFMTPVQQAHRLITVSQLDRLLALLKPGHTYDRETIAQQLEMRKPKQLTNLLDDEKTRKMFFGREITKTRKTITIPEMIQTEIELRKIWQGWGKTLLEIYPPYQEVSVMKEVA